LLGAEGYGLYATVIAAAMLLVFAATLGLPTLTIRMLPSYLMRGRPDLMRGLLSRANQAVLLASIVLGGGGALLAWKLAVPGNAPAWWWAMALVPLLALGNLRSASLRGMHRVVLGQVPECLFIPGLFLCAAGLAWWAGDGAAIPAQVAVAMRWAASLGAFAVGCVFILRSLPAAVRRAGPAYEARSWARSAAPSLVISAMAVLVTQVDVLMLAALRGSASAGIYQASARAAELVGFSVLAVNFALQPLISSLYTEGELARLQRIITKAARAGVALALPVALAFAFFAEPILSRVFGAEFARGATCLAILCGAQVLGAALGSGEHIMNMTGHERDTAFALALGAAANVLLNAALIPLWDIEGAALACAISVVLWKGMLAMKVRSRLGLWPAAFGPRGSRKLGHANA
jgi:O-antigen/teichoic acid export membrane protein